MTLRRRHFIKVTSIGLASMFSGLTLPLLADNKVQPNSSKPLIINMPSANGKYTFFIDGLKQDVRIVDQVGTINVPKHSCIIEYTGADGASKLSVFIDQQTSQSFLMPGLPSGENELEWNTVLMGNPIRGGKIMANITGPVNSNPVIEITDLQGRTLIKEKVTKTKAVEEFEFDVQRFERGVLLMRVSCDEFSQTLKVIHGN